MLATFHATRGEHEYVIDTERLDPVVPDTVDPAEWEDLLEAESRLRATQWEGWGTALRPSFEPIIIARKPPEGNTIRNVLRHGVGDINIDGARFADDRWPTNVAFDPSQADALDMLTGTWQSEALSRKFPIFRFDHKPSAGELPRAFGVSYATVKPLALMRRLITLVTPLHGVVLEPFTGSRTTLEAAVSLGHRVLWFKKDPAYVPLVRSRLDR